jgi:hypothetical protein
MNLYEESANLSCKHMTFLAKNEINYYNNKFNYITKPNICNNHDDNLIITSYIPSLYITNKSCIYKRSEYNEGNWINQHELKDTKIRFNEQTKNKVSGISN